MPSVRIRTGLFLSNSLKSLQVWKEFATFARKSRDNMFGSDEYKDNRDLLEELVSEVRRLQFLVVVVIGVMIGLALSGHI